MSQIIYIIDDEPDIRSSLTAILEDEGYQAKSMESYDPTQWEEIPDLILLDIWLGPQNGMDILLDLQSRHPGIPIIMISGHGNIALAVDAVKTGAYDFLEKPLSLDRVLTTVRNALRARYLNAQLAHERESRLKESEWLTRVKPLQSNIKLAYDRFWHHVPVLLSGEPGTGKKRLIRHFHSLLPESPQQQKLELLEFFSAVEDNKCHQTMLVVEIDREVDKRQLKKLAQLLSEGKISEFLVKNMCYLIVFSSESPQTLKEISPVSPDDESKISRFFLTLPPLRERKDDILLLLNHYLEFFAQQADREPPVFEKDAISYLESYHWPGNASELVRLAESICLMYPDETISLTDAQEFLTPRVRWLEGQEGIKLKEAVQTFERNYILYIIRKNGANISKAARELGVERTHLYRKLKTLGVAKPRAEALEPHDEDEHS